MEENKFSYHFSLHLQFKDDVDVDKLEKHFNMEAYRKNSLENSKGINKTAKLWFRTKELTNVNTHEMIENFTTSIFENFADLKEILSKFNGKATFSLIITKANERPIISLTYKTIEMFYKLGLSFDVDFM